MSKRDSARQSKSPGRGPRLFFWTRGRSWGDRKLSPEELFPIRLCKNPIGCNPNDHAGFSLSSRAAEGEGQTVAEKFREPSNPPDIPVPKDSLAKLVRIVWPKRIMVNCHS